MMQVVLIYAFAAATLGGFDSPIGAVVGGLIIGLVSELVVGYVDLIGNDLRLLPGFAARADRAAGAAPGACSAPPRSGERDAAPRRGGASRCGRCWRCWPSWRRRCSAPATSTDSARSSTSRWPRSALALLTGLQRPDLARSRRVPGHGRLHHHDPHRRLRRLVRRWPA